MSSAAKDGKDGKDDDKPDADEMTATGEAFDRNAEQAPEVVETVILPKPLGVRIQKKTMRVVHIDQVQVTSKTAVGDKLLSVNGKSVKDLDMLNLAMKDPGLKALVTFRRKSFSQCVHKYTTVETLTVKKDPHVMRAVDVYMIRLTVHELNDDTEVGSGSLNNLLGLIIAYDSKDRVEVVGTTPGSLSSVHFRPHDVIREINGHPVASKAMVQYWIMDGIEREGHVRVVVEAPVGTGICHSDVDMPDDVHEIARRQLRIQQSQPGRFVIPQKSILKESEQKPPAEPPSRHALVSDSKVEMPIASDYDAKNLVRVKGHGQH